jgi:hypothetical protein
MTDRPSIHPCSQTAIVPSYAVGGFSSCITRSSRVGGDKMLAARVAEEEEAVEREESRATGRAGTKGAPADRA